MKALETISAASGAKQTEETPPAQSAQKQDTPAEEKPNFMASVLERHERISSQIRRNR